MFIQLAKFHNFTLYVNNVCGINSLLSVPSPYVPWVWRYILNICSPIAEYRLFVNNGSKNDGRIRIDGDIWRICWKTWVQQTIRDENWKEFIVFNTWNWIGNDRPSLKTKYSKMNDKIDQVSKRIYSFVLKLQMTSMILFCLVQTAINYFFYDLGDESFYLKFLAM